MDRLRKSHHVVPAPNGGWKVQRGGARKASKQFDTQRQAIDAGRLISQNQKTELFVHGKNGRIRIRDSHGNDPKRIKG